MSDWKMLTTTSIVDMHRSGWRGLWDAVSAFVMRRERLSVPTPVTFSVWVKPGTAGADTFQPQIMIEQGKPASAFIPTT